MRLEHALTDLTERLDTLGVSCLHHSNSKTGDNHNRLELIAEHITLRGTYQGAPQSLLMTKQVDESYCLYKNSLQGEYLVV